MTTEAMIKPANMKEQLLGKLNEMRQKNLTARQKEEIRIRGERLTSSFKDLTWTYFGIDRSQINELSDQELEVLFSLVYNRARKISVFMKILGYGIPMIGWPAILTNSQTIRLANSTRKLKKILGSSFDPVKIIRQNLNGYFGKKEEGS